MDGKQGLWNDVLMFKKNNRKKISGSPVLNFMHIYSGVLDKQQGIPLEGVFTFCIFEPPRPHSFHCCSTGVWLSCQTLQLQEQLFAEIPVASSRITARWQPSPARDLESSFSMEEGPCLPHPGISGIWAEDNTSSRRPNSMWAQF